MLHSTYSSLDSRELHQCLFTESIPLPLYFFRSEQYKHPYCDNSSLVAFGALNEIVICSMRPIKEIFQTNKPSFCKEKSLPYLDWGFGLTPS